MSGQDPESPGAPPPPPPPSPGDAPPPASKDENMWAMLCHLSALAGFIGIPFGNVVGPLIVWLIQKDKIPIVDQHGKEAVNFQIGMAILGVISILLIPVIIGIFTLMAVGIFDLVVIIIASMKANAGEFYRYPLCIRFIK